jgi:hypothetical protein
LTPDRKLKFTALLHHVSIDLLRESYKFTFAAKSYAREKDANQWVKTFWWQIGA